MVLLDIIMVGMLIGYIEAWIFMIADTEKCRKCEWEAVCMNSTLSHNCPKRNHLSQGERRELKKMIDEFDD